MTERIPSREDLRNKVMTRLPEELISPFRVGGDYCVWKNSIPNDTCRKICDGRNRHASSGEPLNCEHALADPDYS